MPSYRTIESTACCENPDYEHDHYENKGGSARQYRQCQTCGNKVRGVFVYGRVEKLVEGGYETVAVGECCSDAWYRQTGIGRDEAVEKFLYAFSECQNCGDEFRDVFEYSHTETT